MAYSSLTEITFAANCSDKFYKLKAFFMTANEPFPMISSSEIAYGELCSFFTFFLWVVFMKFL